MRVSECKFYDSKMRPLLLVYDNPDTLSVLKDVRIMFKHGDGMYVHTVHIIQNLILSSRDNSMATRI